MSPRLKAMRTTEEIESERRRLSNHLVEAVCRVIDEEITEDWGQSAAVKVAERILARVRGKY